MNGTKHWITNSPHANILLVWAKDEKGDIRAFVLERDKMEGIKTPKIEGKHALRASTTGMIFMENVKVPKENMLDTKGLNGAFSALN